MLLYKVYLGLAVLGSAVFTAAAPLQDELQVRQTGCTSDAVLEAAKSSETLDSTILDLEKREGDTVYGPGYCSAGTAQWCYFCYYGAVAQVKCYQGHRCTVTGNACYYSDANGIAVCS